MDDFRGDADGGTRRRARILELRDEALRLKAEIERVEAERTMIAASAASTSGCLGHLASTLLMLTIDFSASLAVMWLGWRWFVAPLSPVLDLRPASLFGLTIVVGLMTGRIRSGGGAGYDADGKKIDETLDDVLAAGWRRTRSALFVLALALVLLYVTHRMVG